MPSQRILDAFYQLYDAPVEADLDSWEEYIKEGLDALTHGLSFLEVTQEQADTGEDNE